MSICFDDQKPSPLSTYLFYFNFKVLEIVRLVGFQRHLNECRTECFRRPGAVRTECNGKLQY
jgi:hypothetical protein